MSRYTNFCSLRNYLRMEKQKDEFEPIGPIKIEGDVPPPTKWKKACFLPFVWMIPETLEFYINTTKCTIYPYVFGVIMVIFDYFWWQKYILPVLPNNFNFLKILEFIFLALALLSMEIARYMNPGILPWNWALTKKKKFTTKELRDGFAITDEQIDWAKSHESPKRAWFSGGSGFFILRGDHMCGWLGNWVGQKNHRYFVLGLLYGTTYITIFWVTLLYAIYQRAVKCRIWITCTIFIITLFFSGIGYMQMFTQIRNICKNTLLVEMLSGTSGMYAHGKFMEGWIEVFGPLKYFPLWFIPIPIPPSTDGFSYEPNPDFVPIKSKISLTEVRNNSNNKPLL